MRVARVCFDLRPGRESVYLKVRTDRGTQVRAGTIQIKPASPRKADLKAALITGIAQLPLAGAKLPK